MARYLLGGLCEGAAAVTVQKLGAGLVRAANLKQPARKVNNAEIVKPLACVYRVERLCTVKYIGENIFDFTG